MNDRIKQLSDNYLKNEQEVYVCNFKFNKFDTLLSYHIVMLYIT